MNTIRSTIIVYNSCVCVPVRTVDKKLNILHLERLLNNLFTFI